jgi:hypothetical protein
MVIHTQNSISIGTVDEDVARSVKYLLKAAGLFIFMTAKVRAFMVGRVWNRTSW